MNNKEIAERLRQAADELENDETCIREFKRDSTGYFIGRYGISCTVKTKEGEITFDYVERPNVEH